MKNQTPRAQARAIVQASNIICSAPKGRNNKKPSTGNSTRDNSKYSNGERVREQRLLRRSEKFRLYDEYRHDQTRQRRFELAFESRDLADSEAAIDGEAVSCDTFALLAGHGAALFGRRSFSLLSPADLAMFTLDLEYWEERFRRAGRHKLLCVLRALASGASAEDIGIPERTFRRRARKIENILSADPPGSRLGL